MVLSGVYFFKLGSYGEIVGFPFPGTGVWIFNGMTPPTFFF
jgi:hypothetical protein